MSGEDDDPKAVLEAFNADLLRLYHGVEDPAVLSDEDYGQLVEEAQAFRKEEADAFGDKAVTAADAMDLEKALATVGRVFRPVDPKDLFPVLLFGAEAHLVDLLESVFYLGFKGPTGSGKGTGVETAIRLAQDGEVLGSTTEAYLATVLDEGKAVGIEEADKLIKKNPAIASLLRNGYRRGAYYGFKLQVEEGKKTAWETRRRSLFGPKAFDFHSHLDAHLLGRTVVVEMRPEDDVDLALDADYKARHLAPVRLWLGRLARPILADAEAAKGRVTALWEDQAFRARVRGLGGKAGRDHVLGANLLLLCHLLGWNLEEEVRRLMATRKTLDEFSEEIEVVEEVLTWWRENGGKGELATDALLYRLNAQRESTKDPRRLTPHRLGTILRDLGFEKGRVSDPSATWVRAKSGENRDQWVLRPRPLIEELTQVAQVSHFNSQSGSVNGSDGTDGPLPLYEREGDVDPRTFRRLPPEDVRPGRCPRCGNLRDLLFGDPNGKTFCEGCVRAMTGEG